LLDPARSSQPASDMVVLADASGSQGVFQHVKGVTNGFRDMPVEEEAR
jgi:hypothetical protein